ncbi:MAG: MBL fold metallo-hydrolase, partial [Telluria sp.]|nr:MBL fold metallo-hydrolase [Telluria sp.]
MNHLESQLDYPFGDTLPAIGAVHELAPGLQWLRMPLPFALDHINLWLIRDEADGVAGWSGDDCGVANDATRAAWEQIFSGPMQGQPMLRMIATHCHPDHIGLSDWLCRRFDAPLWATTGEYGFARMMSAALPGVDGTAAIPHFERHGLVDPALRERMGERRNYYPSLVPAVPQAYTRMQDGQEIRIGGHGWRVIAGFGHSPEHAALYCAALNAMMLALFSGWPADGIGKWIAFFVFWA